MDHSFQEHIWMFKVVFGVYILLCQSSISWINSSRNVVGVLSNHMQKYLSIYCDLVLRFSLFNPTV